MPHGYGMEEEDGTGATRRTGPAINDLTSSDYCDELSKTPFHKNVPVRLQPLSQDEAANQLVAEELTAT